VGTDPDPASNYTQQCVRKFPAGLLAQVQNLPSMRSHDPLHAYWRANVRLIAVLLSVWFLTAYIISIVLAPWLNQFRLGNAPLGFWFAQQGSIYVFILLIWIYARRMDTLDRQYDVHE
jgi:putative solute:sodium symporter small subunit